MTQALVAVFENQIDARHALDALFDSGFSCNNARLSSAEYAGLTESTDSKSHYDEWIGDKISRLPGISNDNNNETYSQAVLYGKCLLIVNVVNDDEAGYAEVIMEQYNPVDIDEGSAQWLENWPAATAALG